MTIQFKPEQHIHIIGIGGSGMSAIARLLLLRGVQVSGSDQRCNTITEALVDIGAIIFEGHAAQHVNKADWVIASSAVPDDHIEIVTAQAQNIPVYRRMDIMGALMAGYTGIAVAGTHGKTTTTSMIAHILIEADHEPSYIVGGVMGNTGHNADAGTGRAFVIEADEYGNMFLGLTPQVAVLTSVEFDHPDFFATEQELTATFAKFIAQIPEDGLLIACADDAGAHDLAQQHSGRAMLYGIESGMWQARQIRYETTTLRFSVYREEDYLGQATLPIPGRHNILNALAALIVADHQGVSFEVAAQALSTFISTGRRFDVRGESSNIIVVDDYAHHPTAIQTTLEAAKQRYPNHQLIAIWQPHTYSRTQQLWGQFLAAFSQADQVLVTDVYAAREADNPAVRSSDFVAQLTHASAFHTPTLDDTVNWLIETVKPPAVILIMSAGDAPQIGERYLQYLREHNQ